MEGEEALVFFFFFSPDKYEENKDVNVSRIGSEMFPVCFKVFEVAKQLAVTAQQEGSGFDSSLSLDWVSSYPATTGMDTSSLADLDWE